MIFKNSEAEIILLLFLFVFVAIYFVYSFAKVDSLLNKTFKKSQFRQLLYFYPKYRKITYFVFIFLSLILIFASLNPSWGKREVSMEIENLDLLYVIDASRSMSVHDADTQSRLTRTKQAIRLLNSRLEGSRFGIVAFAGTAFYYCPITGDLEGFDEFLEALNPEVVGDQGSGLGDVNRMLNDIFDHRKTSYPVMIFISDGEFHNNDAISDSFVNGQGDRVPAYVLGVGSEKGGQVYYSPDPFSQNEVPLVLNGKTVESYYQRENLIKLADDLSGSYSYINDSLLPIIRIADSLRGSLSKVQSKKTRSSVISRAYLFAWPAIFLLMLAVFIDSIRKKENEK